MPFMVTNQLIHQESGRSNLQQITSKPRPILPKSILWFQLSWGYLSIIPLIMVMLRFTLQSFHLNLTLYMLHIQTPIRSNKLTMMKWNISWNSSTKKTMMIFWMLTSRWFRLYWCSNLLKKFIWYLLCCFINMDDILQSQIVYHTFICLFQKKVTLIMSTRDMSKQLSLFYVFLLTVKLYIKWDQFIFVQVTLPTPYNEVP